MDGEKQYVQQNEGDIQTISINVEKLKVINACIKSTLFYVEVKLNWH